MLRKYQQGDKAGSFLRTRDRVSADVEQAAAPVSARLRDGGDGCGGAAEAGLCERGVGRCTGALRHHVILAYRGKAPNFLFLFWTVDG